jgi:hypothetical protein
MLLERVPVSDDGEVILRLALGIEGALVGHESGVLEDLAAEKSAVIVAAAVLDDVAHFADRHFGVFDADPGFSFTPSYSITAS